MPGRLLPMSSVYNPEALAFIRKLLIPDVAALLMEGSAYGLYVPLFCSSIHTLCCSMKDASNRRPLMYIATVLFLLTTSHWILQAWSTFIAIYSRVSVEPTYPPLFSPAVSAAPIIQTTLYVTAAILADSVFTHRLFLVWGRSWFVVIFPIVSMVGASITMITLTSLAPKSLLPGLATYVATFLTNVYITGMISFKIWKNNRAMASLGHPGLTSVIPILIESAGIYTVSIAVTIITFWTSLPIGVSTQSMLVPMVGITYSLMIVLVARGRSSVTTNRTALSGLAFHGHGTASLSGTAPGTRTDVELQTFSSGDV